MKMVFASFVLLSAFQVRAQSVAQAGHECSEDFAIAAYHCINPDGGLQDDVRLSVYEYQDCSSGKITSLDKDNFGIYFLDQDGTADDDAQISVQYDNKRTHMDDRDGDKTMVLPVSAEVKTANDNFKLTMSQQKAPDHDFATETEYHYVGSYVHYNSAGKKISSGPMMCYVAM